MSRSDHRFLRGEIITSRGDRSNGIYLIIKGELGAYHYMHPDIRLINLGPGSMIGDTWLLDENEHYDIM